MRPYIHDDFLLHSDAAQHLYHEFAADQPIYDYHNHLPPAQIAQNHAFANLADLWMGEDHYKWRAMRANGVPERFLTGGASAKEKYLAWAATVPATLRNPLYHWTHLELKRFFDNDTLLCAESAEEIWDRAQPRIAEHSVHRILARQKVAVLCTTDDPANSLADHRRIAEQGLATRVYPTFRPDRAYQLADPLEFNRYCERLGPAARQEIRSFDDLLAALKQRHDDFHACGCRLSDHGFEAILSAPCTLAEARTIFQTVRDGRTPSPAEQASFGGLLMLEFGRWDAARAWTKQLHLGVARNNNARQFRELGADTGFDSISDARQGPPLTRYLSQLNDTDELPQMVVYNLNPADNFLIATLLGNFQGGDIPGKMQFGTAWWFLDQREGLEWQMNALSHTGLLSRFVGMLTDSRSFMSFCRHEYFRRVMCNLLGAEMARGELPADFELVGPMVRNICFANARRYFGLELDASFAA